MDSLSLIGTREAESKLSLPVQSASDNPRLEFRDGQFLFAMQNQEGGLVERFVSAAAVREAFAQIPIDSGWLPPEIVRWGNGSHGEWAVAFFPPANAVQSRALEISNEGSGAEFSVERIKVPLPGLVFFGMGTNYHIWAVKTAELRPYHEIYRCPLPNVYQDGAVCWGLVKPTRMTSKSLFDAWELFIASTFNNHLAAGKSKRSRDDVRVTLRDVAANELHYPAQDLIRQVDHTGVTLDQAITQFLETGKMPQ